MCTTSTIQYTNTKEIIGNSKGKKAKNRANKTTTHRNRSKENEETFYSLNITNSNQARQWYIQLHIFEMAKWGFFSSVFAFDFGFGECEFEKVSQMPNAYKSVYLCA